MLNIYERFKYGTLSAQEIEDALEELQAWRDADLGDPKMCCNVSTRLRTINVRAMRITKT
jgi:hypothetical protein